MSLGIDVSKRIFQGAYGKTRIICISGNKGAPTYDVDIEWKRFVLQMSLAKGEPVKEFCLAESGTAPSGAYITQAGVPDGIFLPIRQWSFQHSGSSRFTLNGNCSKNWGSLNISGLFWIERCGRTPPYLPYKSSPRQYLQWEMQYAPNMHPNMTH